MDTGIFSETVIQSTHPGIILSPPTHTPLTFKHPSISFLLHFVLPLSDITPKIRQPLIIYHTGPQIVSILHSQP